MGYVRQVVGLSYFHRTKEEVQQIGRFIMKPVDSGDTAISRIQQGSGHLSQDAKQKAIENLLDFVKDAQSKGKEITACTFGRGLMDLPDDEAFQTKLKDMQCYSLLVPSVAYW
jgi:hypothetical protein